MPSIPADLYFGPELPDSAVNGAVFNDGVCLYRGGEHGWLYMCHVNTIRKMKNSPLADYAIDIPEGELASLNEPMASYRNGSWVSLSTQRSEINVYGLVFQGFTATPELQVIPDETMYVFVKSNEMFTRSQASDLELVYRHNGEDYVVDKREFIPMGMISEVANQWLHVKEAHMPYLDLDMTARFVVNTDKPPVPGDNWIDSEFNEFVFSATKVWEYIGKLPFNYKGSYVSGIDVLRLNCAHRTGDAYLVDNFVYIYNSIVKRFVVIQCDPGSDNVPFELYTPGAIEPIPIQGIYRRSSDALPSETNGCGYLTIENDGSHKLYNQYGLLLEVEHSVHTSIDEGRRAPMVVMGDVAYRQACYQWDGLDPQDGDVWLHDKKFFTFYLDEWRLLPAGELYADRHRGLAAKVEELKQHIHDNRHLTLSEQTRDALFEQIQLDARKVDWTDIQTTSKDSTFRKWLRRLCSSKPR